MFEIGAEPNLFGLADKEEYEKVSELLKQEVFRELIYKKHQAYAKAFVYYRQGDYYKAIAESEKFRQFDHQDVIKFISLSRLGDTSYANIIMKVRLGQAAQKYGPMRRSESVIPCIIIWIN